MLFIVRHGETYYNIQGRYLGRIDLPLNPAGIHHTKELAMEVKDLPIDEAKYI